MVHCRVECDAQFARQGILSEGSLALELEHQRLSIAELIRAAVRAQMLLRRLREQSKVDVKVLPHLSELDIEKGRKSGRIALKNTPTATPPTDWHAQEQRELTHALTVFNSGGFQVLLDGELHRDADEIVTLSEQSTIVFLRLIPLAGG